MPGKHPFRPVDLTPSRGGERVKVRADGSVNLDGRAKHAIVSARGSTFLATNAYFDGTNWQRYDVTLFAALAYLDQATGAWQQLTAVAAANPITWVSTNTAWTALPYAANWSDFGAPWRVGGYRRDHLGRVHLRGMVKKSVAVAAPDTIFTLPAGFRPAADEYFAVNSNGAFGTVFVTSAGLVRVQVGNLTYVSLSGISFDTA